MARNLVAFDYSHTTLPSNQDTRVKWITTLLTQTSIIRFTCQSMITPYSSIFLTPRYVLDNYRPLILPDQKKGPHLCNKWIKKDFGNLPDKMGIIHKNYCTNGKFWGTLEWDEILYKWGFGGSESRAFM